MIGDRNKPTMTTSVLTTCDTRRGTTQSDLAIDISPDPTQPAGNGDHSTAVTTAMSATRHG